MLLLLVSFAMLSAAWGQTSNCPNIRYIQASQQTLVNTTAQIKDMLSRHTQQQSASESLTNLMQLTLARQLMADLDIKPATNPCSPANSCDCNETATALKQLETESIDNKEAIRNLTSDKKRLQAQSVDNKEAIRNLTTDNERLRAQSANTKSAIHNLTISNERLEAQSVNNRVAIRNLTADNERLQVQCMNNSETIRNLTVVVERLVNQNLNTVCGSSGWTRVAYLNMTDPSEQCPSGFRLYNQNSIRACGRPATSALGVQSSVQFPIGMKYSEVCGRVTGYQYWGPDAFASTNNGINQYIDGVSLTHGSPRKHIWSFGAANRKSSSPYTCPCTTGSSQRTSVPAFVGNDYFCESGYSGLNSPPQQLFSEALWDGKGCSSQERACCQAAGIPWFHKRLTATTNDNIELRVCASNGAADDEDSPVSYYEIYVK